MHTNIIIFKGIEIAKVKEVAILENILIHNAQDLERAELFLQNYHRSFFIGFMLRYHPLVKKNKRNN